MYGAAGDKATDLDQIGRFLFNFGNPTKRYALARAQAHAVYLEVQGKPDNKELSLSCQLICKIIQAGRETIVSYFRVFPVYCYRGWTNILFKNQQ